MQYGVVCLGEALIDFIPTDQSNQMYEKSAGGAPANVAVGVTKLGARAAFIGKVGDDVLGRYLKETLVNEGVNTSGMIATEEARTGLTFVELDENGERNFSFYINPSADQFLCEHDVSEKLFVNRRILHIGSISMIHQPAVSATKRAIGLAKENGLWLSFDPNLRPDLWKSPRQAHDRITSVLSETDILKVSEEELAFITGKKEIDRAIQALQHSYNIPLVFITLGARGSIACVNETTIHAPGVKINSVDTTGAGDAFVSAILYRLDQIGKELSTLNQEEIYEIVRFANVSGAIMASKKGVMTALPDLEAVNRMMS